MLTLVTLNENLFKISENFFIEMMHSLVFQKIPFLHMKKVIPNIAVFEARLNFNLMIFKNNLTVLTVFRN